MSSQLSHQSTAESTGQTAPKSFPYDGDRTGFLPTVTARGVLRSREPAGPIGTAGSTACPSCGGETIDGAGLFACTDCDWTGVRR